ncbi:MAG TPA: ribonuclease HII [Candidatus Omnitrophota bacterium]|nr:ribonuclease HII [Candidatus Omnitrophota bacterium]
MLSFERQAKKKGFEVIIGIDEAGRGPLAGPVVASAVWLTRDRFPCVIKDSKQMTPQQRQKAYHEILGHAHVGIGMIDAKTIDRVNILQATFQAMAKAVCDLVEKIPENKTRSLDFQKKVFLLVDGNRFETSLPFAYQTIIAGDSHSLSIACASIVAKVTRDAIMDRYDKMYPQYGFRRHKGYPTFAHRQQIRHLGFCAIHRKTFHCGV